MINIIEKGFNISFNKSSHPFSASDFFEGGVTAPSGSETM
jgi:hypothetical protein